MRRSREWRDQSGVVRGSFCEVIPQSAGIPSTAIAIEAKYDAKYGAPSIDAPKVFFKYFFVNTATGGKSGEKMAGVGFVDE